MSHDTSIFSTDSEGSWRAICACGWMGEPKQAQDDALRQAREHALPLSGGEGQQLLVLRERARTRSGEPSWNDVDFLLFVWDRERGHGRHVAHAVPL